jgi:hypothetical protein
MKDEKEKPEVLTGPHEQKNDASEAEPNEETEAIQKAIDVATDLSAWTKTPAGRDTVDRLRSEARLAMNDCFSMLHENPELGRLVSALARFEASVQMIRRFVGADTDLEFLMSELEERKAKK